MEDDARSIEERLRHDRRLLEETLRQDNLIYGGLIAGSVALLQPFVDAPSLDTPATIAVMSFSVAIPLLAALLMVGRHEAFRHRPTGLRLISVVKVVGQGLAVLGIAATFWHIAWFAGVAVLASAVVGVFVHGAGWWRLEDPASAANKGQS